MKASPRRCSTPSHIASPLHQRLNTYALAASAAGVSLLALGQPAEARIVYTKTDVVIGYGGVSNYMLELTNSGHADFSFTYSHHSSEESPNHLRQLAPATGGFSTALWVRAGKGYASNEIWGHGPFAAALRAGVRVGRGGQFQRGHSEMAWHGCNPESCNAYGSWLKVQNRYLAFKFFINGAAHYGWARLSCSTKRIVGATLTGYAYETVPNKPIVTGRTKGPDDADGDGQTDPAALNTPAPQPATLGVLALGARGLSIWRRRESVSATE